MASDLSDYAANAFCLWLAGTNMPAAPAVVYAALFNGDPKVSGTEVTTTIRPAGRVAITWDSISAGSDRTIVNDANVDFGNADAGATVTHVCLMDDDTAGNQLASHGVVGGGGAIAADSPVKFLPGDLTFTI